jgi:hypothetical protein
LIEVFGIEFYVIKIGFYLELETETAKALRAFRKVGTKGAKFYHHYSKGGKDLRSRKKSLINFHSLRKSVASLPPLFFWG